MSQPIKFEEVVVARPFIIVEHEYAGAEVVGIKSRRETVRGEKIKLPAGFVRELVGGRKAVLAKSDEAAEIVAEIEAAAKPSKKAEA